MPALIEAINGSEGDILPIASPNPVMGHNTPKPPRQLKLSARVFSRVKNNILLLRTVLLRERILLEEFYGFAGL